MKSRFKTANIVAILIAVTLFAIGFALNFLHQKSESDEKQAKTKKNTMTTSVSIYGDTPARAALIQTELPGPDIDIPVQTHGDQKRKFPSIH